MALLLVVLALVGVPLVALTLVLVLVLIALTALTTWITLISFPLGISLLGLSIIHLDLFLDISLK